MAIVCGKKIKLFTLSANPKLAEEISKESGVEISKAEIITFKDGEMNVNIEQSVRGCDVYVVQPTCPPVNTHYMELFIFIDALRRASAASVNIIMPYYGYSRQDRKALPRQPITSKLMADLLQRAGADRIVCIDLHAAQIQGFFDIPIDNFPAGPLLASYFKRYNLDNIVVVSPDHGGTVRAREFAKKLGGAPLAIIDKRRPQNNVAEVLDIIGHVEGKNAIIVDDMIDSAGTLIAATQALKEAGAKSVYAAATHPVFSSPALERIKNCEALKKVIVTNTIPLPENAPDKIVQISIGHLLGRTLLSLINDEPISHIFDEVDGE